MRATLTIALLAAIGFAGCSAPDNNRPTGNEPADAQAVQIEELTDEANHLALDVNTWGDEAQYDTLEACEELPEIEGKLERMHEIQAELSDSGESTYKFHEQLVTMDEYLADAADACGAL